MSNLLPKSVTGECAVRWKDGGGGCPVALSSSRRRRWTHTALTLLLRVRGASGPMEGGDDPAAEIGGSENAMWEESRSETSNRTERTEEGGGVRGRTVEVKMTVAEYVHMTMK